MFDGRNVLSLSNGARDGTCQTDDHGLPTRLSECFSIEGISPEFAWGGEYDPSLSWVAKIIEDGRVSAVKLLPLPQPPVRARTDARTNPSAQRATQLRSVLARVYAVSIQNQITTTVP
jgi:hypothetical protein